MFTTPVILDFLISSNPDPYDINPKIIAIDEFDMLLSNPGIGEKMHQIIRKFGGTSDKLFAEHNKK